MFEDSKIKLTVVSFILLVLLILSIWGVFSVAKNLFKSNNSEIEAPVSQTSEISEFNEPGTIVSYELQGPIVAESEFLSYRITIGRTERTFQLMRGYEGTVESEQRYENNPEAYESFLRAIANAGFTRITNNDPSQDERGSCPMGRRFIYSANNSGEEVFRKWNTSCNNSIGTSRAGSEVRTLFIRQIPDFNTLTSNTNLR